VITKVSDDLFCDAVGSSHSDTFVQGTITGTAVDLIASGGIEFKGTLSGTTISGTGADSFSPRSLTGPFTVTKQ
jgi:hypothetical protein